MVKRSERQSGTFDSDTAPGTASSTEAAMTRSEEELVSTTRVRAVGRVRLRKRVVTEEQTVTVTVRKEVIEFEEEAISGGDYEGTAIGVDGGDDVFEMVRYEEEVVVEKRIVPVERVRLVKTVEVENQTFTDDVRREQIELEGDGAPPRR